jgi:multiple sugar transport system substrate-binding protein
MRLKQQWVLASVVSMLCIILAACGGGSSQSAGATPSASGGAPAASHDASHATPSASGGAPAASSSATASSGDMATTPSAGGASTACPDTVQGAQLTMWSPLTGPDGAIMTQLADRFSQENTHGISVQHVAQPEYLQKLNTAAAGNNLPDMTVIRASDIAEMAARKVLKPMSEEAQRIVGGASLAAEFPEQAWSIGAYQNQRYAIPLDIHPLVLYYNKDLFQQAGITMPTDRPMNRQEFEAAAEKLNANGVAGIAIGTHFGGENLFETLVEQFGGSVLNNEGTEATFNSEQGVRALTYLRDLHQKYSPSMSGQGDPEVKAFQAGKAAMVIHGPWHLANLQKLPSTGVTMVPQFGDQFAVWGNSHQLALTGADPAKQAATACWIGWLSENSVQWAKAGQVPARKSVRTSEELTSVAAAITNFAAEVEQVVLRPPVPGIGPAIQGEGYGRAVNGILLGQQSDIKAALDEAAQRSNQLIQQNARQYSGQ